MARQKSCFERSEVRPDQTPMNSFHGIVLITVVRPHALPENAPSQVLSYVQALYPKIFALRFQYRLNSISTRVRSGLKEKTCGRLENQKVQTMFILSFLFLHPAYLNPAGPQHSFVVNKNNGLIFKQVSNVIIAENNFPLFFVLAIFFLAIL